MVVRKCIEFVKFVNFVTYFLIFETKNNFIYLLILRVEEDQKKHEKERKRKEKTFYLRQILNTLFWIVMVEPRLYLRV